MLNAICINTKMNKSVHLKKDSRSKMVKTFWDEFDAIAPHSLKAVLYFYN